MAIQFHCPYCTSAIRVADAAAGKIGKCPKCGTRLRVPQPEIVRASMPPINDGELPGTRQDPAVNAPAPAETGEENPFLNPFEPPVAPPVALPQAPAAAGREASPFAALEPMTAGDIHSDAPSVLARRRKGPDLWVKIAVPVVFLLILLGAGGAYWWSQRPTMTGELPGDRLSPETLLQASIPVGMVDAPGEAYDAAVAGLIESPQAISTDLMFVELLGGPEGLQVRLQAGPETELVRVDVRRNPLLAKTAQRLAGPLDADRIREFHDAAREFVEAWGSSRSSGMEFGNSAAYRDKLGVNALLHGVGYHSTAIVARKAYPCVHEDEKGRLYFLVPRGTTGFVLTERPREGQSSVFPGEYRFNVTVPSGVATTPTPAASGDEHDAAEEKEKRPEGESPEMPAPTESGTEPTDTQ